MKRLITLFVKYPFYANLIIVIILFGGIGSLLSMKKSFFPEMKSRNIVISVAYPGASPKEMEEGITTRIEEAIRGIVGIKEFTSSSSENFSRVRIETTGEYDLDETLMEVKNAVDGISSFPSAAERPVVYKVRAVSQACYMAVSGNVDLLTLKKYADQIEYDLLSSGVISQVSVNGLPPVEISVEVTEQDLMRYNLTFDAIQRAISLNNRDISAGMIKSENQEILIRSRKRSVDPNKIGEIIIRANNDGSFLRIRDIAEVKIKFADIAMDFLMNGKQAISFSIQKLPEEDLDEISKFCKKYAKEFNEQHSGVKLELTFDFLSILKSRLELLYRNGIIGLILVIVSLALFLNTRLSLWVAWGIPASFLCMFIIANMYGITINMISLFGMILVIGILVDDGIVIGENIFTHFEQGKSPKRAAIDGTIEVAPAVITSVSTTIIAFSPLLFIKGSMMEFMFEMALVVVIALFFSLWEAFFVLPAHLANKHILHRKKETGIGASIREYLNRMVNFMKIRIYGKILKVIIKWRWIFVTMPIALILLTTGLFGGGLIKATFFPPVTFDMFNADLAFKPGSGEKRTYELLQKIEKTIWEVNDSLVAEYGKKPSFGFFQNVLMDMGVRQRDTNDYIKYTYLHVGSSFDGKESGGHAGNIFVTLRDMEGLPISSFYIIERIKKKIGKLPEVEKFRIGGRGRFGKPVSISLLGKNLDELKQAQTFLQKELNNFTSLQNITSNQATGAQEIKLELKPKAYFLGLDHSSISNQIRQGFYGGQAQRLQQGKDELRVWVRYPKNNRVFVGQLENVKIKTPMGDFPLSELANYTVERGPVRIQRFNASREIRVDADLVDPYEPIPPILANIDKQVIPKMKAKFPGVKIFYQGQQRGSNEAMQEMVKYFGVAFAVIVLVLMIHFKSAGQGLLVLMMIPLSWIGASWGHGIEGIPVSILSAWGMVTLSGVIINDAVVFLSKYNSLLLSGQKVETAAYNAGIARFRAIVLTTITTSIGLYPMILEKSFQAKFLIPMALSLAYGVLIGTAFILLFFPALIVAFNDIKYVLKRMWTGKKPVREDLEIPIIHSKSNID